MMQVSSRGWRTHELGDETVVQEHPKMLAKMVQVVYGNPPNFVKIKHDLCGAPVGLLRSLSGHRFRQSQRRNYNALKCCHFTNEPHKG